MHSQFHMEMMRSSTLTGSGCGNRTFREGFIAQAVLTSKMAAFRWVACMAPCLSVYYASDISDRLLADFLSMESSDCDHAHSVRRPE